MKRLFLGTSFSGHVNSKTGEVDSEYREKIEAIIKALRKPNTFTVFCAVEHEKWLIAADIPPEVTIKKDLTEVDQADAMLALLPTGLISAGLQYEIGYADAKGKQVILATEEGAELGYFNQGAVSMGHANHVTYSSADELASKLQDILD